VFALAEPTPAIPASSFLVALDVSTGATVWTSGASTGLIDLAIDGNTIYVGGSFDRVGASARTNIAAFDASTGALLAWGPLVGGFVTDVAVQGSAVAFGGGFGSVGGIKKRGLVSLDLSTGRPTAVQPPDIDLVNALASSGDLVVAARGGGLGVPKEVFAYSASSGQRYPKVLALDAEVSSMAINGATLFLGGGFSTVDGQARRNLAAYDLASGAVLPWNPSPDGMVLRLRVDARTLFVAGQFLTFPGVGRSRTASFDLDSMQLTSWNPQHGNDNVTALEIYQDRVLIGGTHTDTLPVFPFVRTVVRSVAVDRNSGALLNVDLPLGPNLALVGGTLVVAGPCRGPSAS
jgi:trimeric autotransporter adhesin